MYPITRMKAVVKKLWENKLYRVFLLGGGKNETAILNDWQKEFPGIINLAGKFSFKEELAIISHMDMMVSMDSANMHLASLFGVPVVSVWGATHPLLAFMDGVSQAKMLYKLIFIVVPVLSLVTTPVTGVIMPVCSNYRKKRSLRK